MSPVGDTTPLSSPRARQRAAARVERLLPLQPDLEGRFPLTGTRSNAEGITNPSIDDLLEKTDSKYKLVLYSAKRARQINAYYSQLGEGLLEYVGPLVDTHVQEKPLSVALREIEADLVTCEDIDPEAETEAALQAEVGRS